MNTIMREMLLNLMQDTSPRHGDPGAIVFASAAVVGDQPQRPQLQAIAAVSTHMDLGEVQQVLEDFAENLGPELGDDLAAQLDGIADAAAQTGKAFPTEGAADAAFSEVPVLRAEAASLSAIAVARVVPPNRSINFADLKAEYRTLFEACVIRPEKLDSVKWHRDKLIANKSRYQAVASQFGAMPWWFVGIVHALEASFRFNKHLHNGDPLSARTVNVPAGRLLPPRDPPYTWEESARDALEMKNLARVSDWSLERCLYLFESFNGYGYRQHRGIHSPYLWSFSTYYSRGKYVRDGRYDPDAVSKQCGAAVIVRDLANAGLIGLPSDSGDLSLSDVSRRGRRYRVTAAGLNVRSRGALTAPILGSLDKGELVELLDEGAENYWLHIRRVGGVLQGYASHKYLLPSDGTAPDPQHDEFPWMAIATGELGQREIVGPGHNPRILKYLRSTTLDSASASRDETAWCSAFVNWCLEQAGYAGTDSAWAKDWINWGRPISEPRPGCIVVWDRDTVTGDRITDGGHVGFYLADDADMVRVRGGNQSNAVSDQSYPKDGMVGSMRYRLLGYRIP